MRHASLAAGTFAAGARAAEDLASALLGFSVRKAVDPLSPAGFLLIGQTVADKLSTAAVGAEAAAVGDVIHKLGVDWKKLSSEAATAAMNAVNKAISASYATRVMPKIDQVLEVEGPRVMKGTKKSLVVQQKIEISGNLDQRDLAAEKAIRKSQVNFIRDASGKRVEKASAEARKLVERGVKEGLSSAQISKDLLGHFARSVPRPESYWRTVADSFIGRARTTSQMYAYEDADIQTFEIVAVIDEVTTDQCRFMDGKVFTVTTARAVLDAMQSLEDPEEVRYASPWIRKGRDPHDGTLRLFVPHSNGTTTTLAKIDRSGVGRSDDKGAFSDAKSNKELGKLGVPVPPFHGRCRTTTVASAEQSDEKPPVMVPGADLVPAAAPLVAPEWMTAETLEVVGEAGVSDQGVNPTKILTLKTPDGEKKAVWKPVGKVEGQTVNPKQAQAEAGFAALDHAVHGDGAITPNTVVRKLGRQQGSLQEFVPNAKGGMRFEDEILKDTSAFAEHPGQRKAFLLDVLSYNNDRHSGNLLWTETAGKKGVESLEAHTIDNGGAFTGKGGWFAFIVNDPKFIESALKLDKTTKTTIEGLSLEKMDGAVRQYDKIEKARRREMLVRAQSLKNDPDQLAKLVVDSTGLSEHDHVEALRQQMIGWMSRTAEAHGLTAEQIAHIDQVVQ